MHSIIKCLVLYRNLIKYSLLPVVSICFENKICCKFLLSNYFSVFSFSSPLSVVFFCILILKMDFCIMYFPNESKLKLQILEWMSVTFLKLFEVPCYVNFGTGVYIGWKGKIRKILNCCILAILLRFYWCFSQKIQKNSDFWKSQRIWDRDCLLNGSIFIFNNIFAIVERDDLIYILYFIILSRISMFSFFIFDLNKSYNIQPEQKPNKTLLLWGQETM